MPDHNLKALEGELRSIGDLSNELAQIIYKKGYTTPREFALVFGAVQAMNAQMKNVVAVSREIIAAHAAQAAA
jgi:hypothetical protein